jgi:cellulose synthase/poly-beta-1,6-N-acetylglucosamine synthase-like glycosyltransferase
MNRRIAVSVIIPVAPGCSPKAAVRALEREARGAGMIELMTITGRHPSLQRNLAAARAQGEWLYFLDHDSIVQPGTLRALLKAAKKFNADAAGGPNVGSPSKRLIDRAAEFVLKSPVGSPFIYRRYLPTDAGPRKATELSLILCNLLFRRETFLRLKGFDPRLYPNEENELLNRLADEGGLAISVPGAAVEKSRHYTLDGYIRENFRYGRGRMQQVWVNPHSRDIVFIGITVFIMLFFLTVAALILPITAIMMRMTSVIEMLPMDTLIRWCWPASYVWICLSLVYIVSIQFEELRAIFGAKLYRRYSISAVSSLILLRHVSYASGLVWGALTGWRARKIRYRAMPVTMETRILPGGRSVKKAFWTGLTPVEGETSR